MRLTNTQTGGTQNKKAQSFGTVSSCDKVTSSNQSLICVKKAVGHTKAVLSICAADNLLVSGSKDLTCKVWNMSIGSEVLCLGGHPNYVSKVRYCEVNRLVYTVSNSFVKMWDIRAGAKCITVLSSSGLVHDSIPVEPASSSQAILQQGEQQIFDIQVSRDGHKLYTTTGTTVQLWDLNTLSAVGKVASGHQAPIICLSLYNDSRGKEQLLTGSKDHLIKGFDISNEQTSNYPIQAKFTMDPPHYDGVQCLAHRQDILFSGSRDMRYQKMEPQ
ncbi:kinesin-like protein KIF21A [Watersipora subatra]|uniref:kinesin-like protein KIF21A n=1 Tax=Watersipora subatra TaxID=2589382 RepID=UPI00355C3D7F